VPLEDGLGKTLEWCRSEVTAGSRR
jgi:hypothetical protein